MAFVSSFCMHPSWSLLGDHLSDSAQSTTILVLSAVNHLFIALLVCPSGGVVNLYKNQGNLHIHDSGKKEIQIKREKIYTNSDGCRDIHFGK